MGLGAIVDDVGVAFDSAFWSFVTFVPMLKVLFAIAVGFLWSLVLRTFRPTSEDKKNPNPPIHWWMQHTTPMYIILLVSFLCELVTFYLELGYTADAHACLADPTNSDCELSGGANFTHAPTNTSECMNTWKDQQQLDQFHNSLWVGTVARCAPIFATFTFLVTAIATFRHVRASKSVALWDQTNRGATIWILQLPVVYSMTALFSVEKGLKQARMGGYACTVGDSSLAFLVEAGLSFGDGYEAIALLLFADITMNVIEYVVDKTVLDAESVKEALDKIEQKIDDTMSGDDNASVRQSVHNVKAHTDKVLTRLEQMSEELVHSTWSLSALGIRYFAFTCLVMAIPQLLACQALVWEFHGAYDFLHTFSENWATTFKGMGLLGSCVAIHNMVSIETNFDEAFLQGYQAKYKFISVKIMVSIVFIQEMILPMAFNLTLPRAGLFDASLRIMEFSIISLFNLWAWPLDQPFYKMEAIDVGAMEHLTESLTENDGLVKVM